MAQWTWLQWPTVFLVLAASTSSHATNIEKKASQSEMITPHDEYSSALGVLGCKIDTNRVAYWPDPIGCDDICVKVSNSGRSLNLLRVDYSTGAYDISYDAWNYLGFGMSATVDPKIGGAISMEYEYVPAEECRSLLEDGKLPLSAATGMLYLTACIEMHNWVAQNYELLNIVDPNCQYGYDEICDFSIEVSSQPTCPHTVGSMHQPTGLEVTNIVYGTGKKEVACD